MNTEGLGDGRAGDIGIQNAGLIATALHGDGQLAGDHRLANAALTGNDAVDLTHPCFGMVCFQMRQRSQIYERMHPQLFHLRRKLQ